jgi:hypothetical protein
MPRPKRAKALTRSIGGPNWQRLLLRTKAQMQRGGGKAGPALAGCCVHRRPDGSACLVRRSRTRVRCGPFHAAPLCRVGPKRSVGSSQSKQRLHLPREKANGVDWAIQAILRKQAKFAARFRLPRLTNLQRESCRHCRSSAGAETLDAISSAFNQQGIRTARGKRWHISSVANLLARAKTLAAVRSLAFIGGNYR